MKATSLNRLLSSSKISFISLEIVPPVCMVGESGTREAGVVGLDVDTVLEDLDDDVMREGREDTVDVRGRAGGVKGGDGPIVAGEEESGEGRIVDFGEAMDLFDEDAAFRKRDNRRVGGLFETSDKLVPLNTGAVMTLKFLGRSGFFDSSTTGFPAIPAF